MSEEKHTPKIWRIIQGTQIVDAAGYFIASTRISSQSLGAIKESEDNAEFIVRSVNVVPALLAALDQIRTVCEDNEPETCNKKMALDFVWQVAHAALAAHQKES